MPIPNKLKELRIWTLSDKDKKPLDVGLLYSTSKEILFSPSRKSKCMTYDACKKVQKLFPDTLMTLKANKDVKLTLVDIEKEGNGDFNPYLDLNFIYLEESSNGGLHGLLDYRLDTRAIIKDEDLQTEFFNDNHFMIITEKELPINQPKYTLFDFEDRLKSKEKEIDYEHDINLNIDLSDNEKLLIRKYIFVKPFSVGKHQDRSQIEYHYMLMLGRKLQNKFNYNDIDTFIRHLIFACDLHLPYRDKHYTRMNTEDFGEVTKREYSIMKAGYYIYEEA